MNDFQCIFVTVKNFSAYFQNKNIFNQGVNKHTYLYLVFGETELGEHAKHVDIDSDADGTPSQIWHDWFD